MGLGKYTAVAAGSLGCILCAVVVSQGCGPESLVVTAVKDPDQTESVSQRLRPLATSQNSQMTLTCTIG